MTSHMDEDPYSQQNIGLSYALLGLAEGASRDQVLHAYNTARKTHEERAAMCDSEEDDLSSSLKHLTWAKNTLIAHFAAINTAQPIIEDKTPLYEKSSRPVVSPSPPKPIIQPRPVPKSNTTFTYQAEPDQKSNKVPWWLSSLVVIILIGAASVILYSYQTRGSKGGPWKPGSSFSLNGQGVSGQSGNSSSGQSGVEISGDLAQLLQQVKMSVVTLQFGHVIGSGFLISSEGHIVTNAHVINNLKGKAQFPQGDPMEVNVIKIDPDRDIALVKTTTGSGYPYLKLADSNACREGDSVVAIGSPFNYQSSFTKGIVSGKDRHFPHLAVSLIQTDAAINEGNSGGPLINMAGEVVGINTLKIKTVAEGLNFAIAVNDVKAVIEEGLKTNDADRMRDTQNIETKISQQRQKESDLDQENRERISKARQEDDQRYREQLEEAKRRIDDAKKKQTLQWCFSEVNKKIEDMWEDECKTQSKPERCPLPPNVANRLRTAQLQGQSDCLKNYGD
jgi:S1-C subfamily serine protease